MSSQRKLVLWFVLTIFKILFFDTSISSTISFLISGILIREAKSFIFSDQWNKERVINVSPDPFCFMPRFSTFVAALQKISSQLVNGSFSTVPIALVSSPFFGERSYVFMGTRRALMPFFSETTWSTLFMAANTQFNGNGISKKKLEN